jgi:hypothetical protein
LRPSQPWFSKKRRKDRAGKRRISAKGADQIAPPMGRMKCRTKLVE